MPNDADTYDPPRLQQNLLDGLNVNFSPNVGSPTYDQRMQEREHIGPLAKAVQVAKWRNVYGDDVEIIQ